LYASKNAILNIVLSTGFNSQIDNSEIQLFPNPTSDNFQISGLEDNAILKLADINGKEVLSRHVINNEFISVQSLPKGIYIATLITKHGVIEKKIQRK